jgi:hypothetical protein
MNKILSIIETAYRATIEEQDDTVLWFNRILKNAGADLAIVLRANAVNYAVQGQDASGLRFGKLIQANPPTIGKDVAVLIEEGVPVYVVQEDATERGIMTEDLIAGVQPVARGALLTLVEQFDHVWNW